MKNINIVLHCPEIPQNTGNIARTCAATGAALHLIRPLGFEIDDAKLKRAGLDYWHFLDITYYDSIQEVMDKFYKGDNFWFFSTKAKNIHSDVCYKDGDFLVFGKGWNWAGVLRGQRGAETVHWALGSHRVCDFPVLIWNLKQ